MAEVVLAPAVVQGKTAPISVLAALRRLAEEELDLAIVARGGGSSEDLAAFNDEAIARAVFAFPVPVVSGVGHDTDVSIVDFVADVHAPTPSAAAERATPNWIDIVAHITRAERAMRDNFRRQLREFDADVLDWSDRMRRALPEPRELLANVARLLRGMGLDATAAHARAEAQCAGTAEKLAALSPLSTLERGYAIVHLAEKRRVVRRVGDVKPGARLTVSVVDGAFSAEVS
jgi:exodeoxyribonuclease VII large subunit